MQPVTCLPTVDSSVLIDPVVALTSVWQKSLEYRSGTSHMLFNKLLISYLSHLILDRLFSLCLRSNSHSKDDVIFGLSNLCLILLFFLVAREPRLNAALVRVHARAHAERVETRVLTGEGTGG